MAALSVMFGAAVSAQLTHPEYELKAAVVSKFPEFTEWPEPALNRRRTIDLCVVVPNPFGKILRELVDGESLRGHRLVARDVSSLEDVDSCQLLYLPSRSSIDDRVVLTRVKSLPILTIGESGDFLEHGGIVSLRVVSGRVRFEVNLDAANRAGVRLSSQLLRLAQRVRGGAG